MRLTVIQAQNRYIQRVNNCHPSHSRRVRQSAYKQLRTWALKQGYSLEWAGDICIEAIQAAKLQRNAED